MKKFIFLGIFLLLAASCEKDENRKVVQVETSDGHVIHFMPIDEEGVTDITVTIAWGMTWAYATGKNPAVPYIAAEAILSGGTDDLAPQEILELFNDRNSRGHLYVRADHAFGELSFPKEHIDDVVTVTSKLLATPKFNNDWMNRIKSGFETNQRSLQKQTENKMWDVARFAILGDSPLYNFLSIPNLDDIARIETSDLHEWHSQTITQKPAGIVVTGAINRRDAARVVDQILSNLPKGSAQNANMHQPRFQGKTVLLHVPDAEKTTLALIGQLPPSAQDGYLSDLLALTFFSRGNGPLFDAVRTELRASYGFQSSFSNYSRETRFMFIAGEIETAKLQEATSLIKNVYDEYRKYPNLSGLAELRQAIADGTKKNVLYVDVVARTILELVLDNRSPDEAPKLGESIETVLAKDVHARLSADFPDINDLFVVAASPDANALPGACVITDIRQVAQCP